MNIRQACEHLRIEFPPNTEKVKTAFRARAKETHPDRNNGKDAAEFLQVQAAYEECLEYLKQFGEADFVDDTDVVGDPESELNARISAIQSAIQVFLHADFEEFLDRNADSTAQAAVSMILGFTTKFDFDKRLHASCSQIWQTHVMKVSDFLQTRLTAIISDYDKWLEDFFAKTAEAAHIECIKHWYNRSLTWILLGVIGGTVVPASSILGYPMAGIAAGGMMLNCAIIGGVRAAIVRKRFRRPQVIPLQFDDLTSKYLSVKIEYKPQGISEHESLALGAIGGAAAGGFAIGGPVGAILGAAIGGFLGYLSGKPLDEYKQEALQAVMGAFEEADQQLMNEVSVALERFREELVKRLRKNYHDNLRRQIRLLRSGS
jgi:hypothetical protein